MTIRPSGPARRLVAAALVVAAPILAPSASGAGPAQEPPSAPDAGGSHVVEVTPDDVLRATSSDVAGSLTDISGEVQNQVAAVTAARAAAADADAAVAAADAAVAATESRITELNAETDQVVVDSFINPPSEDAIETLAAPTLAESAVRQSILDRQTNANVSALDQLEAAEAQLDAEQAAQEDAVETAELRAAEADQALEDLVATQSDQTLFVLAVQDRLAANLAEASAVESIDPAAAAAIRAREGELATLLASVVSDREQRAAQAALQQAMADAAARAAAQAAERPSLLGPRLAGPGQRQPLRCRLSGWRVDHRRQLDGIEPGGHARRRGRRREQPVRRWLPRPVRPDRPAARQLRIVRLRHLRGAVVGVLATDRAARNVEPRTGHRDRLHLQRRRNAQPVQPVLLVADGQRGRLRLLQPAERALALEQRRHLRPDVGRPKSRRVST